MSNAPIDAGVGRVLELVDRRPHLAQVAAQLHLPLPLHRHPRQRHHRRREDQQDRRDDEQLDEGEAASSRATMRSSCQTCRATPGSLALRAVGIWHFGTRLYRTVTVTGLNCSGTAPPSGVLATPLAWIDRAPRPDGVEQQRGEQTGAGRAGLIAGPRDRDVDAAGRGIDPRREARRARLPAA